MRFILIIAAGLLQLTSAATVPKSNVKILKRATDHKSVFAPGWPQLFRVIDGKPADVEYAFTYEKKTAKVLYGWSVDNWDYPILEYQLAKGSPTSTMVRVSLVRPARKVGDPPFLDSTGVVHGERQEDQVVTEHDVVGYITPSGGNNHLRNWPINLFANGTMIPDGEFHVAIEVLSSNSSRTTGVAVFENTTNSDGETWISQRFRVARIS